MAWSLSVGNLRRLVAVALAGLLVAASIAQGAPPASAAPATFTDTPSSAYFADAVAWAAATGVTTGVGGTNRFEPHRPVQRAEAITFLWRASGSRNGPTSNMADVPRSAFFAGAVDWAVARGITTGVGGTNRFEPQRSITRAEAVAFLWRRAGSPGARGSRFHDLGRHPWAVTAIGWAEATGVTTGVGGTNRFEPGRLVTRGEYVTMMWRALGSPAAASSPAASTSPRPRAATRTPATTTTTRPPSTATRSPATTTTTRPPTTTVAPTPTTVAPTTTTAAPAPTTVAPTTTTAAPTTTTTVAAPGVVAGRASSHAGTTVGTTQYPVPAGAIVVSPSGSDSAAGTASAPLRTLGRAVTVAPSGATIVLRAGSYHEWVTTPSTKRLTIQSWPGESVWLDGSVVVSGWVKHGAVWRYDGWTHKFDSSPTMTRGAPDNTNQGWQFLNPAYPMAAHPDQVWVNNVAQRQVGSLAEVTNGSFFHDEANNRLFLGTDPTGRTVRASALQRALRIQGDSSVVRGIGIRRYAPSVPDMGAVIIDRADRVTIEHVAITDTATRALSVNGTRATIRNVHVTRSGMLGIGGSRADGVLLDRVLVEHSNLERFNTAPVAGGVKFGRQIGFTARDSIFRDNIGTGLWLDETVVDSVIVGNEMRDNTRHGTSLELSSKSVFADNLVTGNGGWGLKINNTDTTHVWNNTFAANDGSIWLVQDARVPNPKGDSRQPFPELNITWQIGPAVFSNNVFALQVGQHHGAQPVMLNVVDTTRTRTAEQIGVTANGNVYNRAVSASPLRLVNWSKGPDPIAHFQTLATMRSGTGQESSGVQIDGPAVVTASGLPTSVMPSSSNARPLPSNIAGAVGKPSGTRHLGAWTT